MIPTSPLYILLQEAARLRSVPLASLDRVLAEPHVLDADSLMVLRALGTSPIVDLDDGSSGLPCLDYRPADVSPGLVPIFRPQRPLTFDDEVKLSKRIELAKARLGFTLAAADVSVEDRERYAALTGVDPKRFADTWAEDAPRPDVAAINKRWREWLHFRNDLIEHNLPLVERIAMRYRTYGIPHGDLVQHGNLGLIRAADKFDWRRNVRFRTYAEWWIRQSIERATDTDRDVIHVPRPMRQKLSKANHLNRKAGGLKLDANRFAELMGIDREAAAHAFSIKSGVLSIDRIGDEAGHPMRDDLVGRDLGDREEVESMEHIRARLQGLIHELPPREREVLNLRYGLDGREPQTLEEVGVVLGISRERVRQLQARALDQLRESVPDPRNPLDG